MSVDFEEKCKQQPSSEQTAIELKNTTRLHKRTTYSFWSLLFMFLLAGIAFAVYWSYQNFSSLATQKKATQIEIDALSSRVLALQQEQQKYGVKLQQSDKNFYSINALLVAEQLVMAADIALKNDRLDKAQVLLATALRYVTSVPELSLLKQELERAIVALKDSVSVSQEKIALQLGELNQQVAVLEQAFTFSTAGAVAVTASPSVKPVAGENFTWIKFGYAIMHNVAASLRNALIISHKKNLPLVLTASQLVNLKLNLQSLILEAVWGAQHQEVKVYQQALQEVSALLQTYFATNEKVTSMILPTIAKLQQDNFIATAPYNFDKVLRLIENSLRQKDVGYNDSDVKSDESVSDTTKRSQLNEKITAPKLTLTML